MFSVSAIMLMIHGRCSINPFDILIDALIIYYHYSKTRVGQIEGLMMPLPAFYGILRIKAGIRKEITSMLHYYYEDR